MKELSSKMNLLDIVIIGKNEEKVLQKTFTSVIKACTIFEKEFKNKPNVIYIDSNSTDSSILIAKRNSIKYKVITGETTPAIGRIEGVTETNSKYIFFLDGDTEVDENWLVEGVQFLEQNEKVAGVGGRLTFNIYNSTSKLMWSNDNYWNTSSSVENIYDGVGGTFLYSRKAYLKSGGFSTRYVNTEEFDLMLKIIARGYEVKRLNIPMAIHNDFKTKKESFIKRYLLTKNNFISGKVCRNAPKTKKTLKTMFYRFWLYMLHLPLMLIVLFFLLIGNWLPAITALIVLVLCHYFYKKYNVKRTIVSLFSMNFYSIGFYIGFLNG